MDTEKLRQLRSSELKRVGSSVKKEDPEIDDRGYTSLKDVLTRSFSNFNVVNNEDSQFINSSNISIKMCLLNMRHLHMSNQHFLHDVIRIV